MALFGKNAPGGDEKAAPSLPPSASTPPLRPDVSGRVENKPAVIGPHVRIQGELSGEDDVVVEGRVEGKVQLTKLLRVAPSGVVNAEVSAHHVVVAGKIVGNVVAAEKVEILPSGTLEGNIRSPKIVIAEGAQFKGSVDMGGKAPASPAAPSK